MSNLKVNGYVCMCLDKLEGIRGDVVRTDDGWRQCDFIQSVDLLRKWTEIFKINQINNLNLAEQMHFKHANAIYKSIAAR